MSEIEIPADNTLQMLKKAITQLLCHSKKHDGKLLLPFSIQTPVSKELNFSSTKAAKKKFSFCADCDKSSFNH